MDTASLSKHMDSASLHGTVLGGFCGPYSLGVGKDPVSSEAVLVLMIPEGVTQQFPASVRLDAESVKVLVQRGFQAPRPLQTTH